MDKQKITIAILAIALIVAIQYVILDNWMDLKSDEIDEAYQSGYEQGSVDIALSLIQQTNDCQTASIIFDNITRSVFDIDCIEILPEN